jgi:hypothetical protein
MCAMKREFEPPYGSHKVFIKEVGREIEFCNACGEYICKDGSCSNPMCPEPVPDLDPEIEAKIDAHYAEEKKKKVVLALSSAPLPNYVIKDTDRLNFKNN